MVAAKFDAFSLSYSKRLRLGWAGGRGSGEGEARVSVLRLALYLFPSTTHAPVLKEKLVCDVFGLFSLGGEGGWGGSDATIYPHVPPKPERTKHTVGVPSTRHACMRTASSAGKKIYFQQSEALCDGQRISRINKQRGN